MFYSSIKITMPMEFSNLPIYIASILTKDEFEEWVILCCSIWLARNNMFHSNTVSEPQEVVVWSGHSAK